MQHQFQISPAMTSQGEPIVVIAWGHMSGTLSPEQTRQHALELLSVASEAEQQAAVVRWATEHTTMSVEETVATLWPSEEAS